MQVSDFDFDLPAELVAQTAAPRGQSRLLVLDRATGTIHHGSIRDLPDHLRRGDLLVANDTRVVPARLLGHREPSGGAVECLLLAKTRRELWPELLRIVREQHSYEVFEAIAVPIIEGSPEYLSWIAESTQSQD